MRLTRAHSGKNRKDWRLALFASRISQGVVGRSSSSRSTASSASSASSTQPLLKNSIFDSCAKKYRYGCKAVNRGLLKCFMSPKLSGEISKEPSLDLFLTDLEQTAFSLIGAPQPNSLYFHTLRAQQSKTLSGSSQTVGAESTRLPKNQGTTARMKAVQKSTDTSLQTLTGRFSADLGREKKSSSLSQSLTHKQRRARLSVKVGDYVHCGDIVGESGGRPLVLGASGRVIRISESQITLQRTQPVLYYSQAHVHVQHGEWVERNTPILTLTHQTLVTGDIVQGIPRIEQLFEAAHSPPPGMRGRTRFYETLHSRVREIFRENWERAAMPAAVRQSLEQIQQILVESIQKVYLLQGVFIADKHIEIIVRQMTCKGKVLDTGDTGLLLNELLPVQYIENVNLATPGKKASYAPAVVGLTRSALESDSFLSAASFQETTRVLSRDALIGKSDFVRGLKERVVIGDLISAGTGLDAYFAYTLLSPNQSGSKIQIQIDQHKYTSHDNDKKS